MTYADSILKLEGVSFSYPTISVSSKSLKGYLIDRLLQIDNPKPIESYALENISLEINKGDEIGIIGRNGSGKSTLLRLMTGALRPDMGSIHSTFTITPILSLGAAVDVELTCEENLFALLSMHGLSRRNSIGLVNDALEWAEVGNYKNQPLYHLSTGMTSRLIFGLITILKPPLILIDEMLSVGDIKFKAKSIARLEELRKAGTASVIVSHDLAFIEKLPKVIWLDQGKIRSVGSGENVVAQYFTAQSRGYHN